MGKAGETGRSWRDLRVSFRVKMSLGRTPNSATIKVYNLSTDSITLAQEPDTVVRVLAGYDAPRLLFQGNPVTGGVDLAHEGPDRILTVEAKDGGREFKRARLNVSFATGTPVREVVETAARAMNLATGTIQIPDDLTLDQGVTLAGPARDLLDRVALAANADWSIQDGVLQILDRDKNTAAEAVLFSADTGNLVGSPKPKDNGIEIKGLLETSIRPGGTFGVQSRDYGGLYKARDVEFEGDTGFDTPFYVIITGREVKT